MATVLATVCNVIELVKLVQKLGKEYVHTVEGAKKFLIPEIGKLGALKGVLEGIQSQIECDESDSSRISSLACVDVPLKGCDEALQLLKRRLEKPSHSMGKLTLGRLMDGMTKRALKTLNDAKPILELALHADQMTIGKAVESYIKSVAQDLDRHRRETSTGLADIQEAVDYHREETLDGFTDMRGSLGKHQRVTSDGITDIRECINKHRRTTSDGLISLQGSINDHRLENSRGFGDIERPTIVNWVSPLNFMGTQDEIFGRHQEGTGNWALESTQFKDWVASPGNTLWCPGIPGAGKTVLVSIIFEHLKNRYRNHDDVGIACVYCNFKDQSKQTATNLIASIWRQLAKSCSSLSEDAKSLYEESRNGDKQPTLDKVATLLHSELTRFSKVFVLVDALDECSEEHECRQSFYTELRKLLPKVNILLTSRELDTIAQWNKEWKRLEIRAKTEDIRLYVERRISADRRLLLHTQRDPQLGGAIVDGVIAICQDMFLLAKLHMDALAAKSTPRAVRAALNTLPQKLYDTYDQTIERIQSQNDDDTQLALRILSWIAYAGRPLTVRELQHALSVEPEQLGFDKYNMPEEEFLTSVCAGLVLIDKNDKIVRLVHATAQEYFLFVRSKKFPDAQIEITRTCLSYLSFDDFASGYCDNEDDIETRLEIFPFLKYAAQYSGRHASQGAERAIKSDILRFLTQISKVSCSVQAMHTQDRGAWGWDECLEPVPGLWVAATFGLNEIVRILVDQGAEVNKFSCGQTALHRAVKGGHESTVKLLIENKADVDAEGEYGYTPLHLAARAGHAGIALLLLQNGSDATTRDSRGCTTLCYAIQSKSTKLVKILVEEHRVSTECVSRFGNSAMHVAVEKGNEEIVRYLLEVSPRLALVRNKESRTPLFRAIERGDLRLASLLLKSNPGTISMADLFGRTPLHVAQNEELAKFLIGYGADVEAQDLSGRTPLMSAAQSKREQVMRFFIDHSADLERRDHTGRNALQYAIFYGCQGAMKMLLTKGVDVAATDSLGRAALHIAADNAHTTQETIRMLLQKGADVAAKDRDGKTALHYASERGSGDVTRFLLQNGSNAPERDCTKRSALHYAAAAGRQGVLQLLLGYGADVTTRDYNGNTALLEAARGGEEAVQLLIEKGADVAARNESGETALHVAALAGKEKVMRLLVENGADVEAKDENGETALHISVYSGKKEVVRLLVESGADVATKNNNGETALYRAIKGITAGAHGEGDNEYLDFLLDDDLDMEARDNRGRTALHWAAANGRYHLVLLLLKNGADIEATNYNDDTPLHWAAAGGRDEIVDLLLENGANIEAKAINGATPLRDAVEYGKYCTVLLLLARGADATAVSVRDLSKHDGIHVWAFQSAIRIIEQRQDPLYESAKFDKDRFDGKSSSDESATTDL